MQLKKKLVTLFTALAILLSVIFPLGVTAKDSPASGHALFRKYDGSPGYFSSAYPYIDSYNSQLSYDQKKLYDVMKTLTYQQNKGRITLTTPMTFTSQTSYMSDAEAEAILNEIGNMIIPAFYAYAWDNPIAFIYNTFEYGIDDDQITVDSNGSGSLWTITGVYIELNVADTYQTNTQSYIDAVVHKVNSFSATHTSRYGILKEIHDYLCQTIVYDADATYAHEPYGALVAGRAVCEGYAEAFKLLCDKYKIPCALVVGNGVTGTGSEAHMWNYVRMEDGNWYAVDVTWDDQSTIYYDYFLAGYGTVAMNFGYDTFAQSHLENEEILNFPSIYSSAYVALCENGHTSSDWIVTKQANYTTDGERIKKCTVCGEILETEAIPKLTMPTDAKLKSSSTLKVENGYLVGVEDSVTVAELNNEFEGNVVVLDKDGNRLSSGSSVGTGCQVNHGNELITIFISGDLDGDGSISAIDCLFIKKIVIGSLTPTSAQLKAATVSGDLVPSSLDYLKVKKHILGNYNLFA